MSPETWLAYVLAVLALMSTPGPSQLLMMSNALSNGLGRASFTAMGDLTANVLQMLAAGLGLAALLVAFGGALTAVKLAGAGYLIWMGLRALRRARVGTGAGAAPQARARAGRRKLWLQGFATSAANPKAVVFFAALFPQFISPAAPFWPQFLILSATYVVMDAMFLTAYGGAARRMRWPPGSRGGRGSGSTGSAGRR